MTAFLLAAILLVPAQRSAPALTDPPGAVVGRLLAADGSPASGIRVAAMPAPDAADNNSTPALFGISQTDNAGRYRIEGIPPGRYFIFAGLIDYPSYYPGALALTGATAIVVPSGATVSGIDFSLARPNTLRIVGRVGLPPSLPPSDAWTITLAPQAAFTGRIVPQQVKVATDGSFQFPKVPPGEYRLTTTVRGSSPFNLSVDYLDILDLVLPVVDCNAGAMVSGRLVGTPRSRVQTISLTGSSVGCAPATSIKPDGTFAFTNVPEGGYRIQLVPPPMGWSPSSLAVGRVDIMDVEVPLPALTEVKGNAVTEDGSVLPRSYRGFLVPIKARSNNLGEVTEFILGDGSFEFALVQGRYRISVSEIPSGYFVKSITHGFVDLMRENLIVEGDRALTDIQITFGVTKSSKPAGVRLTGRLVLPANAGALPNPEGVLLVSSGRTTVSFFESAVSADGSFEFSGVPPGLYNLETFPDNPAVLYGIVVEKRDVTGIELPLPTLVKVQGGIEWVDQGGLAVPTAPANLSVQFARKEGGRTLVWGALAQTEGFNFYLPEGDYRFSVSNVPGNFNVTSVTSGAVNVLESGLRVKGNSDALKVRVTLRGK